jgi:glycine/D-amino acid oxidase-like deaminating enzyme
MAPPTTTWPRSTRTRARAAPKVRWLESADLRREFPQFRRGKRALLELEAGFLRATDCVAALRALGERHGVQIVTEQEARLEPAGDGVEVRAGAAAYRAPQVVVAAGGWSKRLFPELGGGLWQCQQGIMYLEGVPERFAGPPSSPTPPPTPASTASPPSRAAWASSWRATS